MSRFEELLERDLRQIADRATPSPDAWASIQQRIADQEPIQETEIIMLTDNTIRTRRWPLVAAAAAVAVIAVGAIALVNRGDEAEVPADVPNPTVAPAPDPDAETDSTTAADSDVVAADLPAAGTELPPGRYQVATFGLPVSFEVPASTAAPWTVQVSDDIAVTIGHDAGFANMSRLGSLYDAEQSQNPEMSGLGSISPDDIDGWIDANGIVVDDSQEVTVAGRSAKLRQVRAPEGAGQESCPAEVQPCVSLSSASADLQDTYSAVSSAVYGQFPHTFWIVELADFEPLAVWAHTESPDTDAWLAEIMPLIESIELGDPAPAVEGGTARISTFGTGSDADALPIPGADVDPGRYASDSLGVPVEFDLDVGLTAAWTLANEEPGRLWFISSGSDREFLAMGRLGSWYDATEARTADQSGLGSIPPDDIDGWIAQNGIIVVDSADVEVGGRPAKYRQFRLDTTPGATADFCGGSAPCLWAATGSPDVLGGTANPVEVGFDRVQSIWLVDMDEFEPVYIFAAAQLGDGDEQWFADIVQPIVDSIEFGEPAPAVEGGTARVPERVAVTATMTVNQTGTRDTNAPWPLERTGSLVGDITGTFVAGGMSSPNGAEVTLDWVMDVTIDGLGTGTLTGSSDETWTGDGATTAVDHVIGGTGDFEGVTGFGSTTHTDDGDVFTATIELMLAPRAS